MLSNSLQEFAVCLIIQISFTLATFIIRYSFGTHYLRAVHVRRAGFWRHPLDSFRCLRFAELPMLESTGR